MLKQRRIKEKQECLDLVIKKINEAVEDIEELGLVDVMLITPAELKTMQKVSKQLQNYVLMLELNK